MKLRKLRNAALAAIATLAMTTTMIVAVVAATPAQAWSTTDFNAGNIIDDGLFYDGSAMTTSQIQSFLNKQVPDCTIGGPDQDAGSKWGSTTIAENCLRDFKMDTGSRATNAYCSSYPGRSNETAATIISKVAKACGISPKVLIITLEKEQSLVTDTWPTVRQFNVATGYACPDSGPGNSPNCNSDYFDFFNQVYKAAWQMKVYKAHPDRYNFQKGDTERIQWHPDRDRCGTSTVKIQNDATAALYTYTPYRPNSAALSAGWGEGNSCSSYGNRNFFNFWNSWFGSVRANMQLTAEMQTVYDAALKDGPDLGSPTSPLKRISSNGGGYQMEFEGGLITQSTKLSKTIAVHDGGWTREYLSAGGAAGSWGFLAGNQSATANGFKTLKFQNGTALYNKTVGVQYMPNVIFTAWKDTGSWDGPLGFPVDEAYQPSTKAASQKFQHKTLMVAGSESTIVSDAGVTRWLNAGGYPAVGMYVDDPITVGDDSYRETQHGWLFLPSTTDHLYVAAGAFSRDYLASGGPAGDWGWPTKAKMHHKANGGSDIRFENGVAVHSPKTGVVFISQSVYDDWVSTGGSRSPLGFPTQATQRLDGGDYQEYAKQYRFLGPDQTIEITDGAFMRSYLAAGGPAGDWGWPTKAKMHHKANGGSDIRFENGVAVHSPKTGVVFISQSVYDDWVSTGGSRSHLGFPTQDTQRFEDGSVQEFAKHFRFIRPGQVIEVYQGAFTRTYFAAGGPAGDWGWPTSEKIWNSDGSSEIRFETGVARYTSETGVIFTPNS